MRISCFALLVLVCSLFTSTADAGVGFSVEIDGGSAYVETAPPAVIYTPPPVVYEQQPVETYEYYESYQSDNYYGDEYYSKHGRGHHKHHRHHEDDDD